MTSQPLPKKSYTDFIREEVKREKETGDVFRQIAKKIEKEELEKRYQQTLRENEILQHHPQFRDKSPYFNVEYDSEAERRELLRKLKDVNLDNLTCIWCGEVCSSAEELEQHESEHTDD